MDLDNATKGPQKKRTQSRESKETCVTKLRAMGYSATDARLAAEKTASTDPNVCVAWLEQTKEQKRSAKPPPKPAINPPSKKKKTSNSDSESESNSESGSESESDHLWDPDEDEEM